MPKSGRTSDDEAARADFDEQLEKWKNDNARTGQRVRRALKIGAGYVPVGTLASLVVEALT
jgi:hypothetical protein